MGAVGFELFSTSEMAGRLLFLAVNIYSVHSCQYHKQIQLRGTDDKKKRVKLVKYCYNIPRGISNMLSLFKIRILTFFSQNRFQS